MKKPVKERYNAKARRSSVGGSSHKNKRSARQRDDHDATTDSNTQLIVPGSEDDLRRKEADRQRRELLAASGQDATATISSKKRKRLDAYIASRLKKEERVKVIAKLAQTSAEVDRTTLKSAATLGTGRAKTMEERIETAGQKAYQGGTGSGRRRRRTMNGAAMQIEEDDDDQDLDNLSDADSTAIASSSRVHIQPTRDSDDDDDGNYTPPEDMEDDIPREGEDGGPVGEVEEDPARRARIIAAASLFTKPSSSSTSTSVTGSALGSALAKGADGKPIMPTMRKRANKSKARAPGSGTSWGRTTAVQRINQQGADSDSSFDSSDSENDSDANVDRGSTAAAAAAAANKDTMGPAPKASLWRKTQERQESIRNGTFEAPPAAESMSTTSERGSAGKGKGKAKASGQNWDQDDSDAEAAASAAATSGKGNVQSYGEDDEDEDDDDDSDLDSEEPDTDADEEAVFLEAMRLRGLLPPDEPQSSAKPGQSSATSKKAPASVEASTDVPMAAEEEEDDDDDGTSQDESSDEDSNDDEENEDDEEESEEEEEDDDDDDEEMDEEYRSRRRGIGKTARSSGFKDWARAALGMGQGKAATSNNKTGATTDAAGGEGAEDDDTAYNLEPVGGYKVKVSDLLPKDGVARGPLGRDEEAAQNKSTFAAKHYAELREATRDQDADPSKGKEVEEKQADGGASAHRRVTHVEVQRSEDLTLARLRLPVVAEEDNIVRTIMENPVTVICGETGSGKTTQVPQFLYEAGFGTRDSLNPGMIGVTQPRRVAAVSMAQRVASELSLPADRVSHQIRYDATVSSNTAVKFMTDGVLLRELATDFLLSKYSAIMVDEAHERSINTDVLIGVLSRVVRLREKRWLENQPDARPLRLIVMSATLRVSDFTENTTLFPSPPPVINIDARQHPVTVHFNRKTVQDYVTESVKKASKIHARLPPGGILIFLTGQQEITTVCRKLEKRFGRRAIAQKKADRERVQNKFAYKNGKGRRSNRDDDDDDGDDSRGGRGGETIEINAQVGDVEAEEVDLGVGRDLAADVDDGAMADQAEDPDALDTDDDEEGAEDKRHDDDLPDELKDDSDVPMHILPLYSLLPSDKQMRIFEAPPLDSRLVVVATNVAETSLTIPNIRYVIDCGRSKERKYDLVSGVQSYEVSWISKASAAQRAGRAGRTGPGHCYRLYSSAVYEDHFTQFSSPEILRTPVEGLVLSMKAMNIDNVAKFPFPTPPDRSALSKAEKILTHLGALEAPATASISLDKNRKKLNHAKVTELGRTMTLFPVSPRYAKMLAQGQQHGCLPYVVAMVAALSIGDPFIREQLIEEEYGDRRADASSSKSGGDQDGEGEDADADDYDRTFGKLDGDAELAPELSHLTNAELLERERRKARRSRYFATMRKFEALGAGLSDTFRLLSVVGAYEYEGGSVGFCSKNFLRGKAMEEIHKLRAQLCGLISSTFPRLAAEVSDPRLSPPTETQLKVIRQLIAAAYIDQVAVRADLISNDSTTATSLAPQNARNPGNQMHDEKTSQMLWKLKQAGGGDRMQSTRGVPYKAMGVGGYAFIHPTSCLYHASPPAWVCFAELQRSTPKYASVGDGGDGDEGGNADGVRSGGVGTVWLKTLTRTNPAWLTTLGRSLCTFSKPTPVSGDTEGLSASIQALKSQTGRASEPGSRSTDSRETSRQVLVTPTYAVGSETDGLAGGLGWPLPAIKARQTLVKGRWILEL
ncbi:P-loop containing nucleoside triphosphate hydrolase protein [Testicularia cyperi]|uniref:RNA helicase n=1 Tax=Testicularia cyperi TaxID=1882483 RepID=A0A317XKP7_9BASI|nr:P-loop containing nucleoside triphosphate hydrolase protein [Testicularia cyperi]